MDVQAGISHWQHRQNGLRVRRSFTKLGCSLHLKVSAKREYPAFAGKGFNRFYLAAPACNNDW
jgi:hypothetical protein